MGCAKMPAAAAAHFTCRSRCMIAFPTLRASAYFFSANKVFPMRKCASGSPACTRTAAWKLYIASRYLQKGTTKSQDDEAPACLKSGQSIPAPLGAPPLLGAQPEAHLHVRLV